MKKIIVFIVLAILGDSRRFLRGKRHRLLPSLDR